MLVKQLETILDKFSNQTVGVWGDLALDEFQYGEVDRISREAPVFILRYENSDFFPGCAANTIANLEALNVACPAFGFVGDDHQGKELLELLPDSKNVACTPNSHTLTKTRILAGGMHRARQHMLRMDKEPKTKPTTKSCSVLLENLIGGPTYDAFIVSDYGYGSVPIDMWPNIYQGIKGKAPFIALDSRYQITSFPGIDLITPNEEEASQAVGFQIGDDPERLARAGKILMEKSSSAAVLITQGSAGMTLFEKNQPPWSIPVYGSPEPVDVSGAGDTVIATITSAKASGASLREACVLATISSGIGVMKKGTATVTREEISSALQSSNATVLLEALQ